MVLVCDVDGVLADFNNAFLQVLLDVSGGDPEKRADPLFPCWDWPRLYFTTSEIRAAWSLISSDPSWWERLDPLPGAVTFLAQCERAEGFGDEVYFVTSRRRKSRFIKTQTEVWLRAHGVRYPTVIVNVEDKAAFCRAVGATVILDDRIATLLDVWGDDSQDTTPVLRMQPWNCDDAIGLSPIKTIHTLGEFWKREEDGWR